MFKFLSLLSLIYDHPLVHSLNVIISPLKHSSAAIASQTPFKPYCGASAIASVTLTTQMLLKFMMLGMRVLPAPTKTDVAIMAAAKPGSAQASMRSISVPKAITSSSGVMTLIISGAKIHISNPMNAMIHTPRVIDIHAKECM